MFTMIFEWYLLIPLVLGLFYWRATRNFSHWRDRGVNHIRPIPFFGNLRKRLLFQQSFHEFHRDLYFRFSGHRIAGVYEGTRPTLMIRDPNLIRMILVRDFDHFVDRPVIRFRNAMINSMLITLQGSHWKVVRALLTPTFTSGKIKAMSLLIENVGNQMGSYLSNLVNTAEGCNLEMKDFFGRFTLDVIASCAFGVQCDSLKSPNAKFASYASKFNDVPLYERVAILAVLIICPSLGRFLPLSLMNRGVVKFLENVVKETKQHRIQTETWRNDFLQLMIDASQGDDRSSKKPTVLTEDVIIAQSILFLLAGFETSSTVLTFTSYELALNQDIQEKLRLEITSVLKEHDEQCSYEAVQQMEFLDMVICESMRKHPPVGRVDRICTAEYEVPETSVKLCPGASISIPVMGLHYDPQYYPEPLRFDPMRFSSEEKAKRSPYVYLPFGAGPRNCIGARFAMVSIKIALVHLLCNYQLQPCEKTEIPYEFSRFSFLLKSKNGIWINIKRLSDDNIVN